jgi:tetratricopeptide (TPR) repeat protein
MNVNLTIALITLTCLAGGIPATSQAAAQDFSSLLQDAGRAISAGDLSTAEQRLQSVLRRSPDNFHALDLMGIVRAQQQRSAEAEDLFRRVIKAKPEYANAHIDLGLLYVQSNEEGKAISELQEGLRLAPERSDAANALTGILRTRARSAAQAGDLERALSLLLQARKVSPRNPECAFELGMVELRMSLFEDAAGTFKSALEARPEDANSIYGLGRAYMELARFAEAREQFTRYIHLRPNDASGHYGLGLAEADLQQAANAKEEFERSIALQPAQTESYFQLGLIDLDAKDYASAEQNFRRVTERDPNHAGALAAMGRAKMEGKRFDEAVDFLQRAIASDASLREAHYYLGLTYARMGKKEESEQQLAIATQLEKQATEKQRTVFKILNPGEAGTASVPAN